MGRAGGGTQGTGGCAAAETLTPENKPLPSRGYAEERECVIKGIRAIRGIEKGGGRR